MYTIFGSVLSETVNGITTGRCCNRAGVVYRWTFTEGVYACGVYVEGRLIKETGVLVRTME